MQKYWLAFRLALLDILEYRADTMMRAIRYSMAIFLLAMMWLGISRETTISVIDRQYIVTYYVFAAILYGLSNFHLEYIDQDIRQGYISKYLVKPFSPFWHYFLHQASVATFETIFKTVVFLPIVYALGFQWQVSFLQLSLYLLYLPLIFMASFCLFFGFNALTFWFTNVESIRLTVMFLCRFLSGVFIPLSFLPTSLQQALFWLPFPHLAYTPIQVIRGQISILEGLQGLGILMVWTGLFIGWQQYMWRRATHSYESTGI